jgi:hypothetical protein
MRANIVAANMISTVKHVPDVGRRMTNGYNKRYAL